MALLKSSQQKSDDGMVLEDHKCSGTIEAYMIFKKTIDQFMEKM
jgi:hypothetical protein